jgi:hemerythrin-like metal-binding protein
VKNRTESNRYILAQRTGKKGAAMIPLYIKWTEKAKLGITIIDEQHRGLISIINSFHYYKSDVEVDRFLTPIADTMFAFCRIHFMTEETMMKEAGYPGLEDHCLHHHETFIKLEKLRRDRDTERFMQFLKDYWNQHVEEYDRGYVQTLRDYFGQSRRHKTIS